MTTAIKIYHIVHIDNLPSIIEDGYLFSDATMRQRPQGGVVIGMNKIKERRLTLPLTSNPSLNVGECVPFYFCPRSVMLYMFKRGNSPEITYRGGQEPIIHLVADMYKTASWADENNLRWAFTDSNAGSGYFYDYSDFRSLNAIDWVAVHAEQWSGRQDKKQAEFLVERHVPWELIEEIGVYSSRQHEQVNSIIGSRPINLQTSVQRKWYY